MEASPRWDLKERGGSLDRTPGRETSSGEGPVGLREHGPFPGTKRRKDEAQVICHHRGSLLSLSILIGPSGLI